MTKPETRTIDLDEAVAAVRDDEPPAAAVEQAGARVLAALREEMIPHEATAAREGECTSPERAGSKGVRRSTPLLDVDSIRGCADVEALLPAHRAGTLSGPRALLVEDHLHECAACRVRYRDPAAPRLSVLPWRAAAPAPQARRRPARHYWMAAAALLAAATSGEVARRALVAVPAGSRAAVQSLSGVLQRVGADEAGALKPGAELGEGEAVRTAAGAHAVLHLRDGSLLEMDERAELSVTARGLDTTVHLERGQIIIQAAKRRSGRLLVASKDCTVQVTGTVFSVNRGLKGSRVSVIEGHVRVRQGSQERQLEPGEQLATSEAMGTVPVRDEIAWSRDLDRHLALLAEVKVLRDQWVALAKPGLRHESRLLGLLPANTVAFASVPNYGESLGEAYRLFEQRLQESDVLREWWDEADPERHGGPALGTVVERVRTLADYLGEEIVFAVVQDRRGRPWPMLMAEVKREGLQEVLDRELGVLPPAERAHIHLLLRGDLAAISPSADAVGALSAPAGERLPATAFGQRIDEAYREGAGLLFALDLESIVKASLAQNGRHRAQQAAMFRHAGVDGLRHLVVESKDGAGHGHSQALLTFTGPRRGFVSWLAAPAPMGALEFFTPNAQAVGAFVSKSPALVLDDIVAILSVDRGQGRRDLAQLESRLDLRLREDLAATLGGEFAVALDGPLLPVPGWKVVIEVNDPARLQASLQVLLEKAAAEAARHPEARERFAPRLEAEQSGGLTYYALRGLPIEVHYAYAAGYLVAGPSRALVAQALRTRASGDTLGRSGRFRSLLPADGQDHVSAIAYQNLGASLSAVLGAAGSAVSNEQRGSLESMAQGASASLVCAYGREDGIKVSSNTGITDFDPAQLALPMLLERVLPGTRPRAAP